MKVVFSDRAYTAILAETAEKAATETGGLFLGAYRDETWYVAEAIDPGPNSVFQTAYFEYDQPYTQHLINKMARLYASPMKLVGLWHRHPGSFDVFSATDDETNFKYFSMHREGAISMLVNIDPVFRMTMYRICGYGSYEKIPVEVGDDKLPEHFLSYAAESTFRSRMGEKTPLEAQWNRIAPTLRPAAGEPAAADPEQLESLLGLLEADLEELARDKNESLSLQMQGQALTLSDGRFSLQFTTAGEGQPVLVRTGGKSWYYEPGCLRQEPLPAKQEPEKRLGRRFWKRKRGEREHG